MNIIGVHRRTDIDNLIENAIQVKNNNGNAIQIFANKYSKKSLIKYTEFGKFITNINIQCYVHASYTINLAQDWDYHSWWLKIFILEIKNASIIGAKGIVVHLGKQLKMSNEQAMNNMYTSLDYVISKTYKYNVEILLESSTGQGSEMYYNLDDFGFFLKKILKLKKYKNKLGVCIDTCHVYSAGYDLKGKNNISDFIQKLDTSIGLKHIKLIHLNDSKNDLGSKIDRHSNFTDGFIGLKSIKMLANVFKNLNIPIILETPCDNIFNDLEHVISN